METKINVAAILKDKPQETKLYDLLYNIDVELDTICTTDTGTVVWCTNETDNNTTCHRGYSEFGTVRGCPDGLRILLPSKEMRDWSKFSWKKGDVLVNKDGDAYIIFERFADDTYCSFVGKYYLWKENNDTEHFYKNERLLTSDFQKAGKDAAQTYISTIEERLGGKLNRETLEIEKTQPEFKDGDIVYMGNAWNEYIGIIKNRTSGNQIETYAHCHKDSKEEAVLGLWLNKNDSDELRLATNSEKQQLFDALAKEGKAWDAEKKAIVDLPKKCEFKPMDWCLMRGGKEHFVSDWTLCQFSHKMECGKYRSVGGCAYDECISYNDQTKHLLGTTDEWKGGEG